MSGLRITASPRVPPRVKPVRCALAAAAAVALLPAGARAQSAGITVVPTLTLSQTFTDNRDLNRAREADAITQIRPGISVTSRTGRVQGSLGYSANAVIYARDKDENELQHWLSARGTAELVERWLFLDGTANISQQTISAFGTQSVDPALNSRNRTETRNFTLSPHVRGKFPGDIDYHGRLQYAVHRSTSTDIGNTTSLTALAGIGGGRGLFGWAVDGNRIVTENEFATGDQRTYLGTVRFSLIYRPRYDLQFSGRVGREANNIVVPSATTTWGAGVDWRPGPRTQARLDVDHRFFGTSHRALLSHRFARWVWTYTDTRDLSLGGVSGAATISAYDLYFELFASLVPDPVQRDVVVRNFLRDNAIDPATRVSNGFLSSGNTLQRRRTLAFAMQGVRHAVTGSAFAGTSTRLGTQQQPVDDLSLAGTVRQTGYTLGWSYRLTPRSSLNVVGSLQRTKDAGQLEGTDLRSIVGTWSSALNDRSNLALSLRHTTSEGRNAYDESAVIGTLSMRF